MRFGPTVLLEIVSIVQNGLLKGQDVSQALREVEVIVDPKDPDLLRLSDEYMETRVEEG